ncbi:hypothetical protein D3C85_1487000 [compost metagenome]
MVDSGASYEAPRWAITAGCAMPWAVARALPLLAEVADTVNKAVKAKKLNMGLRMDKSFIVL